MNAANAGGNDFRISLRAFGGPPLLPEQGKVPEADGTARAAGPGKQGSSNKHKEMQLF